MKKINKSSVIVIGLLGTLLTIVMVAALEDSGHITVANRPDRSPVSTIPSGGMPLPSDRQPYHPGRSTPDVEVPGMGTQSEMQVVRGRVSIAGEGAPDTISGSMVVTATAAALVVPVRIDRGTWSLPVSIGDRIRCSNIVVNGRPAHTIESWHVVRSKDNDVIELAFYGPELRVIDSSSGLDLGDVTKYPFSGRNPRHLPLRDHPNSRAGLSIEPAKLGSSPVALGGYQSELCLISAPGFSCERVLFTNQSAIPPVINLAPAGGVSLTMTSSHRPTLRAPWTLILRSSTARRTSPDDKPDYAVALDDGLEYEFDCIVVGSYAWEIVREDRPRDAGPLAVGELGIAQGARTLLHVDVPTEVEKPGRAEVYGVVYFASQGASMEVNEVVLVPIGGSPAISTPSLRQTAARKEVRPVGAGVEWGPISIPVGEYRLELHPTGFVEIVRVTSDSRLIETLLPQERTVRVVLHRSDSQTITHADYCFLRCGSGPDSVFRAPLVGRSTMDIPNPFDIKVTGDSIAVRVGLNDFGEGRARITGVPDELHITLCPTASVELELVAGNDPYPLEMDYWKQLRLEPIDNGIGSLLGVEFQPTATDGDWMSRVRLVVQCPGTYRLWMPVIGVTDGHQTESSIILIVGPEPGLRRIDCSTILAPTHE